MLVLANLYPLLAVWRGDWQVGTLVLLYWSENLIIGFYSLVRLLLAGYTSPLTILQNLFSAAFFCIHYSGFVGVHGIFVVDFFPLGEADFRMADMNWPLLLVFPEILLAVGEFALNNASAEMRAAFLLLCASHGVSFVYNYLYRAEVYHTSAKAEMFSPYGRVLVMHVAIIVGAFFIVSFEQSLPLLMILIGLKSALDLGLHTRLHSKMQRRGDSIDGAES